MADKPHIMIVEARFYEHIADMLVEGAVKALSEAGASYERFVVPGALEIPAAIRMGHESGRFDGYIALGCVLRGETAHYDIVAGESARGLTALGMQYGLPIGNGVLTCETEKQAIVRADPAKKNKGGDAARAALALLEIKKQLGGGHD